MKLRALPGLTLPLWGLLLSACIRPLPIDEGTVLQRIARDYRAFYPKEGGDPDPARGAGLLRPRFGLPALLQPSEAVPVELLEQGGTQEARVALLAPTVPAAAAARCVARGEAVPGCYPLALTLQQRETVEPGFARARHLGVAAGAPPPGVYDLYVHSERDAPQRAPRSVWFTDPPPGALRVAHLSDLHIGKRHHPHLRENLLRVIDALNQERPDLVVITGDIVNFGDREDQAPAARELLLRIEAPVLAVMGNHDHGFTPRPILGNRLGSGYAHFARVFHPYQLFRTTYGGWDFIGFDSGSSVLSPRILTRGLSADSVRRIAAATVEARAQQRGVVLLSHAPSRAAVFPEGRGGRGVFGRMRAGAGALEAVMLQAAAAGQQVLHLSGHTHWSDVYELTGRRFQRWPADALAPHLQPLAGGVGLITVQSASHSTFPFRRNGEGHGYALLRLGEGPPQVAFRRFPEDALTRLAAPAR